jgi:Ca2+-transporting ATPase
MTVPFLALAVAQLAHVFNMRGPRSGIARNEVTRNLFVWGALALCAAVLLAVVYVPGLAAVLGLMAPGVEGWVIVLMLGAFPWVFGPGVRASVAHVAGRVSGTKRAQ